MVMPPERREAANLSHLCSCKISFVDSFRELGRPLFIAGAILVVIGAFLYFHGKLPFRLGRLPGDIVHRGEHSLIYFPIVTCAIVSIGLTLLIWLISLFRR